MTLSVLDGTEELVCLLIFLMRMMLIWFVFVDFLNQNVGHSPTAFLTSNLTSAAGLGTQTLPRASSFNAHAILQKCVYVSFFG